MTLSRPLAWLPIAGVLAVVAGALGWLLLVFGQGRPADIVPWAAPGEGGPCPKSRYRLRTFPVPRESALATGFEPATSALTRRCSAIELRKLNRVRTKRTRLNYVHTRPHEWSRRESNSDRQISSLK